ncbi:MAG: hypothetical protein ACXABY_14060 [Candidatus Thorarchaeota archaeon]|jgi:hypothetical protein
MEVVTILLIVWLLVLSLIVVVLDRALARTFRIVQDRITKLENRSADQ